MTHHTHLRMNEDQWRAFDEALQRPSRDVPGLRELLTTPTILDEASEADEADEE